MSRALSYLGPPEIKIKSNWCKACGICVALCPKQVLGTGEQGKAIVIDAEKCIQCGICETHCPDFAISIGVRKL